MSVRCINSVCAKRTKWSNTLKQFVGNSRQIVWVWPFCEAALKGLKARYRINHTVWVMPLHTPLLFKVLLNDYLSSSPFLVVYWSWCNILFWGLSYVLLKIADLPLVYWNEFCLFFLIDDKVYYWRVSFSWILLIMRHIVIMGVLFLASIQITGLWNNLLNPD